MRPNYKKSLIVESTAATLVWDEQGDMETGGGPTEDH